MRSGGHQRLAVPALLESALDQLATLALPATLRNVLQIVQQRARPGLLLGVPDPYFWQALVGRQLAGHANQELALNAGVDSLIAQRVGPQGGNRKVGGLGQAQHLPAA